MDTPKPRRPSCPALIMCEHVEVDKAKGRIDIHNIINAILLETIPGDIRFAVHFSLTVSNHLNPATDHHFKCRHFEKASVDAVGSPATRSEEHADGESAQDGRASGNPGTLAAELVVSPDRRGTWRGPGDGVATREGGGTSGGGGGRRAR